jgi:hypothetical protein
MLRVRRYLGKPELITTQQTQDIICMYCYMVVEPGLPLLGKNTFWGRELSSFWNKQFVIKTWGRAKVWPNGFLTSTQNGGKWPIHSTQSLHLQRSQNPRLPIPQVGSVRLSNQFVTIHSRFKLSIIHDEFCTHSWLECGVYQYVNVALYREKPKARIRSPMKHVTWLIVS